MQPPTSLPYWHVETWDALGESGGVTVPALNPAHAIHAAARKGFTPHPRGTVELALLPREHPGYAATEAARRAGTRYTWRDGDLVPVKEG